MEQGCSFGAGNVHLVKKLLAFMEHQESLPYPEPGEYHRTNVVRGCFSEYRPTTKLMIVMKYKKQKTYYFLL